jgi:hypothetical protein
MNSKVSYKQWLSLSSVRLSLPSHQSHSQESNAGWQRVGTKILYYPNQYQTESGVPYHTLTFTVSFPTDSDVCYFAHCFPYG